MSSDHYSRLGVARDASPDEIRTAFLELAREKHPDRFQDEAKGRAEEEFQAITAAFNVLRDPDRRRRYDADLAQGSSRERQGIDRREVVRVYLGRGVKAYREGQWTAAAESFDRAVREDPGNALAWHHLARACSHERRWLGRAREAIVKACELSPMEARYLELAGRVFEASGEPERAAGYYREALTWGGDEEKIAPRLTELEGGKRRGGIFGRSGG